MDVGELIKIAATNFHSITNEKIIQLRNDVRLQVVQDLQVGISWHNKLGSNSQKTIAIRFISLNYNMSITFISEPNKSRLKPASTTKYI